MVVAPSRGEVWLVDLDPTRGYEQAGRRPAVVVSTDLFNHGPAGLVVVLPLTTVYQGSTLHIRIDPPDGGVRQPSYAKCEDIRSIANERLIQRWGALSGPVLAEGEDRLRILLQL